MHSTRRQLLGLLADGEVHSGESLGRALGISRAAVWKQVSGLDELGIEVEREPGRGYRLRRPLDLLDGERILALLSPPLRRSLGGLRVAEAVESTNARLMEENLPFDAPPVALLAEQQTGGRGRRGRRWISPYATSISFSLGFGFERLPPDFPALGLALGVAARRALERLGVRPIRLKWPNDLYANGAKLGGILLEMRGEPPGACRLVAGIGINVSVPVEQGQDIDQRWTNVIENCAGEPPRRNAIAAALIEGWLLALEAFQGEGFAPFLPEWREADYLAGKRVFVSETGRQGRGLALGVAPDGALEVEVDGALRRFVSGDVSLREEP